MAEAKNYYIKVPGTLVEVTEEVYLTYYRMRRRCSAVQEKDTYNGVTSYDALDTAEILGIDSIPDVNASSVEDLAMDNILRDKLRICLSQLTDPEQHLILALFYEGKTEREYAEILGISQKAVNKRRHKVLDKLRRMMTA